jgi:hypothetical protein
MLPPNAVVRPCSVGGRSGLNTGRQPRKREPRHLAGVAVSIELGAQFRLRLPKKPTPAKPRPSKLRVAGSGTPVVGRTTVQCAASKHPLRPPPKIVCGQASEPKNPVLPNQGPAVAPGASRSVAASYRAQLFECFRRREGVGTLGRWKLLERLDELVHGREGRIHDKRVLDKPVIVGV